MLRTFNRGRYGLIVSCTHIETLRMMRFTPRNTDIAMNMVKMHAEAFGKGWRYRIEDWSDDNFDPWMWENI